MAIHRIPVGIVGAGPAGLLLGHLLQRAGIESITVDIRSEHHVIERVRAGVLEQTTVDLLRDVGLGGRLTNEGLRHEGLYLAFGGVRHRLDLADLTGGRAITVYGQNEIVRDLIEARRAAGDWILFDAEHVALTHLDTEQPRLQVRTADGEETFVCDYIAGCDGFHGISRASIPSSALRVYEQVHAYTWLGVLAQAAPASQELVYCLHDDGFALLSMRSTSITRLYLQCPPDERLDAWPDERIWRELRIRLQMRDGWVPNEGPILQKGLTGMRSFVIEPMCFGRLFLAGDAAHIVPPTGAKGLNLAVADVWRLARALDEHYRTGSDAALDAYSDAGLRRTWRAQRFSCWMTSLLHRPEGATDFDRRRQRADLEYLVHSRAAMTSLAENYVGFPLD
ncbi:p-hydroxybenzoate hydroxylase [Luteitalea pratensis]|uniref:p-hydroxybenzoate hydroxylase n=1 Tax=Luteitalea pratensis TaxID=1855912 RepID=A0A143PPY7_LUTPR|nr:4-hydroxybenzoate 3-monooxygenase [Luteitalea pratensis]AMY10777.1 p-hydroxybenzoate hydroxylase [Luteitalea pratensis]